MRKLSVLITSITLSLLVLLGTTLGSGCSKPPILTITFTTSPQVLDAGFISNILTVQIHDSKSRPVKLKVDTVISLISSSATGRFDTNQSGLFNGSITSVTVPKGTSSASFYYKDNTAGTATITAAELPSQNWNKGTQQETINPALTVTTTVLPDGLTGTYYSQTLGATGGTGTYTWSVTTGVLPVGLTFSGNTISGTPSAKGTFEFTIQVNDGIGTVGQGISISINDMPPIIPLLSVSPTALSFGSSGNRKDFNISNIGDGVLTWSIASNQPWLSVIPNTGTGNATVMASVDRSILDSGNYSGTITVTSNGGTETIAVSVQVQK